MSANPSTQPEVSAIKPLLLQMAKPDLYERHAFRLLELPVEATTRDLSRRRQSMEQATRNHLQPPNGGGRVLPRAIPPTDDEIRMAGHELADARHRLLQELFWFWPLAIGGQAEDEPLRALIAGDVRGATQQWHELAEDPSCEEASAIAWHNLAVYALFSALEQGTAEKPDKRHVRSTWSDVWAWWLPLAAEGPALWQRLKVRIQAIEDPALKSGAAESLRRGLPTALALLQMRQAMAFWDAGQASLAKSLLADVASAPLPDGALEEARRTLAEPLREALQKQGEAAEVEARAQKKHAATTFDQFVALARPELAKIDALIPAGSGLRVTAHDSAALAGLTCQISYGNETDDWDTSVKMLEMCILVAEGKAAKERIKTNLTIVRNNAQAALLRTTCWFCGEQKAETERPLEMALHGDIKTEYLIGGTRRTWRHITVKVPRCAACRQVQAKEGAGVGVGCLVFVLGIILAGYMGNTSSSENGWIIAVIALVVAIVISNMVQSKMPKMQGLKRDRNEYPPVKELRDQGWKDGAAPPSN